MRVRPDAPLIELGRQLEVAVADLHAACSRWQEHPERDSLIRPYFERYCTLTRQIFLMPAATVAGVDVKVRAIQLCYENDVEIDLSDLTETIDLRSSTSNLNEPPL
jgi:hypothetical protein